MGNKTQIEGSIEKFVCRNCGNIFLIWYIPFKSDISCPECLTNIVTP